MKYLYAWLSLLVSLLPSLIYCQELPSSSVSNNRLDLPCGLFTQIQHKTAALDDQLTKRTETYLQRMARSEAKIQKKLYLKDSLKAKSLFAGSAAKYAALLQSLRDNSFSAASTSRVYLPGLDSLHTGLFFLSQHQQLLSSSVNKGAITSAITHLSQLQAKYLQTADIQAFCRQREALLKEQLGTSGLGKQLLGMNKESFYYQQQLAQYKSVWNDRQKLEETVLGAIRQMPVFQNYMQKNSLLSQLFPIPDNLGTSQALAGLQTRTDIQSVLHRTLSGAGQGADQGSCVQQEVQRAQSSLNQLKNKVSRLGGNSGSGEMTMPQFTPNGQKVKRFLDRIEYGFSIQNTSSTQLLPVISDIVLTMGYRLSDKIIPGISVGYKLGMGDGFNHIRFSNQGLDAGGHLDVLLKGSFWVTGGFEYSYLQEFSKISALHNLDAWQKSALLGLTKKYRLGRKEGNVQLLYDFLANCQTPKTPVLKFRIGYSF